MSEEINLPSDTPIVEEPVLDKTELPSEDVKPEETLPSSETPETPEVKEETEETKEEVKDESKEEPEAEVAAPTADNWASKYVEEFTTTGDIKEESIQEIIKEHNLPEELVRNYVEMSKATSATASEAAANEVFEAVGGKDAYIEMVKWGQENLSEKEIAAFDEKVSLDLDSAHMAAAWLKQKYSAAGNASVFIEGTGAKTDMGYKSAAEFQKDLSDPRYERDAQYRSKVDAKLSRTTRKLY